jgi:hypothetical protein
MNKGIIGKKIGMTQVFDEDGAALGVTAIEVEPSVVVQVKTKTKEGYDAVQLGYGRKKQKNVTKPLQGHFNKANKGFFQKLQEFGLLTKNMKLARRLLRIFLRLAILSILSVHPKARVFRELLKDMVFGVAGPLTVPCFIGHPAPLAPVLIRHVFSRVQKWAVTWVVSAKQSRICKFGKFERIEI